MFRTGRTYRLKQAALPQGLCCSFAPWLTFKNILLLLIPLLSIYAEQQRRDRQATFAELKDTIIDLGDIHSHKNLTNTSVYFYSNNTRIQSPLKDGTFDLEFPSSILFQRNVEFCQWQEGQSQTKNEETEEITLQYYYYKGWSSYQVNSFMFNQPGAHHNPMYTPVYSTKKVLDKLIVGPITINADILANGKPITPIHRYKREAIQAFQKSDASTRDNLRYIGGGYFYYTHVASQAETLLKMAAQAHEGSLFDFQLADIFSQCNAGDVRVSFEQTNVKDGVSVIGSLNDNKLSSILTSNGMKVGLLSAQLKYPLDNMLQEELNTVSWLVIGSRILLLVWSYILLNQRHVLTNHSGILALSTILLTGSFLSLEWFALYSTNRFIYITLSLFCAGLYIFCLKQASKMIDFKKYSAFKKSTYENMENKKRN